MRDTIISFEEEPPDAGEMAARIERYSATHAWLVSERGGEVTGYAYASPNHVRAAYRWAADVAVYVDERFQRQGVGRELYEALLGLLRRQRLRWAFAGISMPNEGSVGLHRALGFEHWGTQRQIGWKAGAWHDVSWWQLELGEVGDPPPEPLGPQRLDDGG